MPAEQDAPPLRAARAFAKRMRRQPTVNEAKLWALLRDRRLDALKFRRQVPIGRYIVDFVCFEHRLIVEADGPLHDPARDGERDSWLRAHGWRVLRFANDVLFGDPDRALQSILVLLERDAASRARVLFPPAVERGAASPAGRSLPPHPAPCGRHLLPQGEKERR